MKNFTEEKGMLLRLGVMNTEVQVNSEVLSLNRFKTL